MALTAEPVTAEQAYEFGFIAELAEKGEALDTAINLAERVAKNAPLGFCLLYTSPSPRDATLSRMPSSA